MAQIQVTMGYVQKFVTFLAMALFIVKVVGGEEIEPDIFLTHLMVILLLVASVILCHARAAVDDVEKKTVEALVAHAAAQAAAKVRYVAAREAHAQAKAVLAGAKARLMRAGYNAEAADGFDIQEERELAEALASVADSQPLADAALREFKLAKKAYKKRAVPLEKGIMRMSAPERAYVRVSFLIAIMASAIGSMFGAFLIYIILREKTNRFYFHLAMPILGVVLIWLYFVHFDFGWIAIFGDEEAHVPVFYFMWKRMYARAKAKEEAKRQAEETAQAGDVSDTEIDVD